MPAIKFDVSGVESATIQPQPGFYKAKIVDGTKIGQSKKGNEMLTIVMQITEGEFANAKLWSYILLDGSQAWRLKEALIALGLVVDGKKEKGEFDPDRIIGKNLMVLVEAGTYKDQYQARVKSLKPLDAEDDEDLSGDIYTETNDSEDDYASWTVSELKEELEHRELSATGNRKSDLISRLKADDDGVPF